MVEQVRDGNKHSSEKGSPRSEFAILQLILHSFPWSFKGGRADGGKNTNENAARQEGKGIFGQ